MNTKRRVTSYHVCYCVRRDFERKRNARWDEQIELEEELERKEREREKEKERTENILFRGDFHEYPERLWDIAEHLRDIWKFVLPERGRGRKEKTKYQFWVMAMDDLKATCGEFGVSTLMEVRKDFENFMWEHNGVAPFTVAGPQSLVNVANAKAAWMRTMRGYK